MPGTQTTPNMPETPASAACAGLTDIQILKELVRRGVIFTSLANLIASGEITSESDIDDRALENGDEPCADDFHGLQPIQDATAELRGGRREEACHLLERVLPREWQGMLA